MNRKLRRAEERKSGRRSAPRGSQGDVPSAAARDFHTAAALFAESLERYDAGQAAEAVALLDRVLALRPDLPEVHCNRGVALAALGRLGDAEAAYRRAIALNPNFADAYNNLGNALREAGRLAEAELVLREAVRLKPDSAPCALNFGNTLALQGKFMEAEAAHRRAVELDPHSAEAHNNHGDVLRHLGRLDEAEAALRRAIALRPQFAEAFSGLGNTLKDQGRLVEAEAAHRQAIAVNPHLAKSHNNLATVLLDLGRLDEAERALRHAAALDPSMAEVFCNLGYTLRERARPLEAEALCRQAMALDPKLAGACSNLGNALIDQNRLVEAEAAFRQAVALQPDFAEAHNNLGAALKFMGRLGEGRRAVERAIELAPRKSSYFLNLSELKRFEVGDPHLSALEELVKKSSANSIKEQIELRFALAKAYEDLGRYEAAFAQLLAGNTLKRSRLAYDEDATLANFERLRAAFTPELIRRHDGAGAPSRVPTFIIGMPRSGSTLVEQIVASHPQVFGAGELPTFGQVMDAVLSLGPSGPSLTDVVETISGDDLRRLGTSYVAEITQMAPAAARIVDKMPSNFLFAGLMHLALPNARIIHVFRDPLDTCVSCFSKLFAVGQEHTYDLAELGRYFRHYRALMAHWHSVLPADRVLDVRYEDVVADLEGQARRIIAHCGLQWDERCLAFHETERPVRTASATQIREPIYRHAVGRAAHYETFLGPLFAELSAGGA